CVAERFLRISPSRTRTSCCADSSRCWQNRASSRPRLCEASDCSRDKSPPSMRPTSFSSSSRASSNVRALGVAFGSPGEPWRVERLIGVNLSRGTIAGQSGSGPQVIRRWAKIPVRTTCKRIRIKGEQHMSDIASLGRLRPSSAQLPVSWYVDPEIFALEKKTLFDAGPNYMGHELMVPNVGDYQSLAWMDHAKVLVRNDSGPELLSNVCRHRQAIMLEERANTENI